MTEKNSKAEPSPKAVVATEENSGKENLTPPAKAEVKKERGKKKKYKPKKERQPVSKMAMLALLIAAIASGGLGFVYLLIQIYHYVLFEQEMMFVFPQLIIPHDVKRTMELRFSIY